jgi:hypothetical protein
MLLRIVEGRGYQIAQRQLARSRTRRAKECVVFLDKRSEDEAMKWCGDGRKEQNAFLKQINQHGSRSQC